MIHGIRNRSELDGLSISRLLKVRVGALLKKGVEITATLLELSAPGSPHEKLLLDARLLKEPITGALLGELAEAHGATDVPLAVADAGERKVVALEEERLADEGWDEAEQETQAEETKSEAERPVSNLPALVRAEHRPHDKGKAAGGLFSDEEVERLQLLALTSSAPKEKITALRQLAYAPIADRNKGEIFLHALADESTAVRAEAAGLLVSLGLDRDLAADIQRLEQGETRDKLYSVGRIANRLERGSDLDRAAGLVVLTGRLASEPDLEVQREIIKATGAAIQAIVASPDHAADLVKRLVALLARQEAELYGAIHALCGKLADAAPDVIRPVLQDELAATGNRRVRMFLLLIIVQIAESPEQVAPMAESMAGEIIRPEDEDMPEGDRLDFRQLGSALMNFPREPGKVHVGIQALAEAFPRAAPEQQSYIVRLLGDTCRFRPASITPDDKNLVARLFKSAMLSPQISVRMPVMTQSLAADRDVAPEVRGELAKAFLDNLGDFHYEADIEHVEATLSRVGLPAAEALMEMLETGNPAESRARAARILGEMSRLEGDRTDLTGEDREGLEEILRGLQKASFDPFDGSGEVLVALAKAGGVSHVSAENAARIVRTLLERHDPEDLDHDLLRALGWAAAGRHASTETIDRVIGILRDLLAEEGPDFETKAVLDPDGEPVFRLGGEIDHYAEIVPACIEGLRLAALGKATPKPVREAVTSFVLERWEACLAGTLEWGPLNQTGLAEALRQIALHPRTVDPERVRIVKSLCRRLGQDDILDAVGEILHANDKRGSLATIASLVMVTLLERRDEYGKFPPDEREVILRVLARIAGRRHLAANSPRLKNLRRKAVDELFAGLQDNIPKSYDLLISLRDNANLGDKLKDDISTRLAAYHSVVKV